MAQMVSAFIVVAAAMFYILFKVPQTDAQAPAQIVPAMVTASIPPPPPLAASEPATEMRVAPTSTPAASEPAVAFVPAAAGSMAVSASVPAIKP